jgi:putative endonuclease
MRESKKWNRQWKINLIEEENPEWRDLAEDGYDLLDSRLRGKDVPLIVH